MRWSLTLQPPAKGLAIGKERLYFLLMTLVPLVLYAPVLLNSNGFVWDDPWMLVDNPFVRSLSPDNLAYVFTSSYGGQYSPVNTLYYCLLYQLSGLDPFVFHAANILIHVFNGILVYTFMKELQEQKQGPGQHTVRIADISFICALLFSITTVQVEVVAWISASKILLYAFFFLLAMISYLRYKASGKTVYFVASHVLYILSIGSKEQAVILPVLLILIDYYTDERLRVRTQLNKLIFFAIAIAAGILSLEIQEAGFRLKFTNAYFPFWQRVMLSFYSVCQYVVKILLPVKVGTFYGFPMQAGDPLPPIFFFYVLVGALVVYYLIRHRRNKVLIWGVAFFLVNLALSLHILPLGRETLMADRYCYLSVIGVFFIGADFFFILTDRFKKYNKAIIAAALLYVTAIFIRSFLYVQFWSTMG